METAMFDHGNLELLIPGERAPTLRFSCSRKLIPVLTTMVVSLVAP